MSLLAKHSIAPHRSDAAAPDRRVQRIDTEVVVLAPCELVHAWATNASRWHRWHPATRSVEPLPDRPLALGETVTEHIAAGGRRFTATWAVTAVEAPALWTIETDTPQGWARITYRLDSPPQISGVVVTRFRRSLEFRSASRLMRSLDPLIARWVLGPQSQKALHNLKRVIEAG
jgi:Polyketide cyclase / dehydrase and lipid transport